MSDTLLHVAAAADEVLTSSRQHVQATPRRRSRAAAAAPPPSSQDVSEAHSTAPGHGLLDTDGTTAGAWGGDSPMHGRGSVSGHDSCALANAPRALMPSPVSHDSAGADSTGAISGGSTPYGPASDKVLLEGQQMSDPRTSATASSTRMPRLHRAYAQDCVCV